jgi:hypothetical protein
MRAVGALTTNLDTDGAQCGAGNARTDGPNWFGSGPGSAPGNPNGDPLPSAQQDLIHVLARDHRDHSVMFHELMDRIDDTAPRHRRRQYAALVLHLGVHMTAETLLVHPLLVAATAAGEATKRAREREILSLRDRLTEVGAVLDDPDRLPDALRTASSEVAAHADREELEVFVFIRHVATPKQLRRMGRLHATLRQRLPTRYQREGSAPTEPWSDPGLLEVLQAWYDDALPDDEALVVLDGPAGSEDEPLMHEADRDGRA